MRILPHGNEQEVQLGNDTLLISGGAKAQHMLACMNEFDQRVMCVDFPDLSGNSPFVRVFSDQNPPPHCGCGIEIYQPGTQMDKWVRIYKKPFASEHWDKMSLHNAATISVGTGGNLVTDIAGFGRPDGTSELRLANYNGAKETHWSGTGSSDTKLATAIEVVEPFDDRFEDMWFREPTTGQAKVLPIDPQAVAYFFLSASQAAQTSKGTEGAYFAIRRRPGALEIDFNGLHIGRDASGLRAYFNMGKQLGQYCAAFDVSEETGDVRVFSGTGNFAGTLTPGDGASVEFEPHDASGSTIELSAP